MRLQYFIIITLKGSQYISILITDKTYDTNIDDVAKKKCGICLKWSRQSETMMAET